MLMANILFAFIVRDVLCSVDVRCKECRDWSTESMLEYLKHKKSLVSKGKKR